MSSYAMTSALRRNDGKMRDFRPAIAEAELHGLLQDPARIAILHALRIESATADDLAKRLDMPSGEVIDHVQALWHAELVSTGPEGTYRIAAGFEAPLRAIRLYILRRTERKK